MTQPLLRARTVRERITLPGVSRVALVAILGLGACSGGGDSPPDPAAFTHGCTLFEGSDVPTCGTIPIEAYCESGGTPEIELTLEVVDPKGAPVEQTSEVHECE